MSDSIELISRGVCVAEGHLLLCHGRGAANTYLPGGHIDFGESAAVALVREIEEEAGLRSSVVRFLGAVEHDFLQKGARHCEVNLVFELSIAGISPRAAPPSLEADIDFRWLPLAELADSNLEPAPLRWCLPDWLAGNAPGWATTMATFQRRR